LPRHRGRPGRYIRELYQDNALVRGEHHVAGQRVDLAAIACPVLTVVAERDSICPPCASTALNRHVGSAVADVHSVPGGHVGAIVGRHAPSRVHPQLAAWLRERLSLATERGS